MAVHMAEKADISKERGAAGAFPDGIEDVLDTAGDGGIGGAGDEFDGTGEEEIDRGLDAPTDVVLNDDFAAEALVVGGRAFDKPREPRRQPAFLRESVATAAGSSAGSCRRWLNGVAEISEERFEARLDGALVLGDQCGEEIGGKRGGGEW